MAVLIYQVNGEDQVVVFDAVISESFENSAEVTSFPVEKGVDITDHVRPNREVVSFDAAVSNTPAVPILNAGGPEGQSLNLGGVETAFDLPNTTRVSGGVPNIVGNNLPPQLNKAKGTAYEDSFDRIDSIFEELLIMMRTGVQFTYVSRRHEVKDLVFTAVSTSRDASTGSMAVFSCEAVQVIFAQTETTDNVPKPKPAERRADTSRDKGNQPAEEVESNDTTLLETARRARRARGLG